ncbi:MAG: YeeE/YedE family protein [Rhodobacteraceae bacterium]|nr:YeeE/YedE family protein [Paracoccaceae bacterium]
MFLALSLLMGLVLGVSAHRAGLCTVKAVSEVLTTGSGWFLWSFIKASLWVTGIVAIAALLGAAPQFRHWPISWASLAGGLLFGIGAGINGSCTFSTLSRLVEGHISMLFTILGWPLGLALIAALHRAGLFAPVASTLAPATPAWLLLALAPWMAWEAVRIVRQMRTAGSVRAALRAPVWTLSFAVAVVAAANAGLLLNTGTWSFTTTLMCTTGATPCATSASLLWPISLAALAGMAVSAALRGSPRLRRLRPKAALRHGAAGVIMGAGAGMVPGGNDGLILFGMPSLSPHALPAYAGMLVGITAALFAMRALGRPIAAISCQGDLCRARM